MTTWWTDERVDLLESEALSWVGTPFAGNSCSKGLGVSCANLCGALYEAVGYGQIGVPEGPTNHARFNSESIITPFFDGREDFVSIDPSERLPGDILGFRIGKCVHHIGILLRGGRFVHALDHIGVAISTEQDITWISRLNNVWRPKS